MNKILKLLLVLVVVFVCVSGCSCKDNNDDDKVRLQIGDMNAQTYEIISETKLNKMIDNEENFLLFVYQEGCYGCRLFKPILESAIKERHLKVYAVEIWSLSRDHSLTDIIEYTPTIVLYEKGEVETYSDPDKNSSYFGSKDGFLSFLDKYTRMPTLYYIDKNGLDEKIANGDDFIVYYSRKSCEDCSYLNRNYLKEYLDDNYKTKHFYILETDAEGIRLRDGQYDENQWVDFKNQYGLSNVNNSLGHGVGYVPTLQYYSNGQIKEMMVYFNDGEYVENSDGSYSIVINNSYYNDNPYIGQTILASEYRGKLESFYNHKLKQFLDINLKKVD